MTVKNTFISLEEQAEQHESFLPYQRQRCQSEPLHFKPADMTDFDTRVSDGIPRPRRNTAAPRLILASMKAVRQAAEEFSEQVQEKHDDTDSVMTISMVDSFLSDDIEDGRGWRTPSTVGSWTPDSSPRRSTAGMRHVSFAMSPDVHTDGQDVEIPQGVVVGLEAAIASLSENQQAVCTEKEWPLVSTRGRAISSTATCSTKDEQQGSLGWRAAVAHGSVAACSAALEGQHPFQQGGGQHSSSTPVDMCVHPAPSLWMESPQHRPAVSPTAGLSSLSADLGHSGVVTSNQRHAAVGCACCKQRRDSPAHVDTASATHCQCRQGAEGTLLSPAGRFNSKLAQHSSPQVQQYPQPPQHSLQPPQRQTKLSTPVSKRPKRASNPPPLPQHHRPNPPPLAQMPQPMRLAGPDQALQTSVASGGDAIMESVRASLASAGSIVKCVDVTKGSKGWIVTGYVQPDALKVYRSQLYMIAQRSLLEAAERSEKVFVIGYAENPFSPMPLGFGAALSEVEDLDTMCWSSYSRGFCENPSTCCKDHPTRRVGVHVMLKPARTRLR